jgi:hypothetical protein
LGNAREALDLGHRRQSLQSFGYASLAPPSFSLPSFSCFLSSPLSPSSCVSHPSLSPSVYPFPFFFMFPLCFLPFFLVFSALLPLPSFSCSPSPSPFSSKRF